MHCLLSREVLSEGTFSGVAFDSRCSLVAFSFLPRLFRCGELVSQRGLVGVINLQVLGTPGAFSSGVNGPERELGSRLIAPEGELGPPPKKTD